MAQGMVSAHLSFFFFSLKFLTVIFFIALLLETANLTSKLVLGSALFSECLALYASYYCYLDVSIIYADVHVVLV